jgi:hypothetical protein
MVNGSVTCWVVKVDGFKALVVTTCLIPSFEPIMDWVSLDELKKRTDYK